MISKSDLPGLTGVRGIAAWWVVLYHFREYLVPYVGQRGEQILGQGYLAVDLFFELSGFIIALNYADRFRTPDLRETLRFLGMRLARIYPLHIFILMLFLLNPIAIALFSTHPVQTRTYDIGYFLMSIFLVQNWGFTSFLAWNVPAWSISTEWLAYLLFPLAAYAAFRLIKSSAHAVVLMAVLLCVLAAGLAVMGATLGHPIPQMGAFRCLAEFSLGMCLCFFWTRHSNNPLYATLAAVFAAVIFTFYGFTQVKDYTIIPLGFLLVIFASASQGSVLSRLFSWKPLVLVGAVSYSTYLIHFFVMDWAKFLLVKDGIPNVVPVLGYLTITAAASVLLYRYIELPGRVAGREWTMRLISRRYGMRVAKV